MALPHSENPDHQRVLDLLADAQACIGRDELIEAEKCYRDALADAALEHFPSARTEVLANCGALLLHRARTSSEGPEVVHLLDQAIDMLSRARSAYRLGHGEGSSITTDTNLALAYFQRHVAAGEHADLMRAHIALDGAEAAAKGDDREMIDSVRTIRDLLIEHVDRRRDPR